MTTVCSTSLGSEVTIYEEKACCICTGVLENSDTVTLPCGHKCMHASCFIQLKITKCPLCRKEVCLRSRTASAETGETSSLLAAGISDFQEIGDFQETEIVELDIQESKGRDEYEGRKIIRELGRFRGYKAVTFIAFVNTELFTGRFYMQGRR